MNTRVLRGWNACSDVIAAGDAWVLENWEHQKGLKNELHSSLEKRDRFSKVADFQSLPGKMRSSEVRSFLP